MSFTGMPAAPPYAEHYHPETTRTTRRNIYAVSITQAARAINIRQARLKREHDARRRAKQRQANIIAQAKRRSRRITFTPDMSV